MEKEKSAEQETKAETPAEAKADKDILKKERDFVVPGDLIVKSMDYLPGKSCFREGESLYAKKLGLVSISGRVISVIPLNTVYIPKYGDMVIAEVSDIQSNGWILELNSSYEGFLPLSGVRGYIDTDKTDLARVYNMGDMIYAKVSMVKKDSVHVTMQDPMCKKFRGGRMITVNPAKIPRIIGKKGSMVNMIKDKAGTKIHIGQNGLIWIDGGDENLVINSIGLIDRESHTNGLTDKVAKFLEKGGK